MRKYFAVLILMLSAFASATPTQASGIIYIGTDASDHFGGFPQGVTLTQNAVQFAGGNSNPSILLVGNGGGFGGNTTGLLTAAGFTYTTITPGNLAATNLSAYQVVYFAPTTVSADVAFFVAAATQVKNYTDAGGGLVVEPEVFATGSWSWVPYANLIGHSGATNVAFENVALNSFPPLSTGLTSAGLSNWGVSVHSTFSTPGAAGFSSLTTTNGGVSEIIFRANASAVPEPATLAVFGGIALAGALGYRRRKATASV